MKKADFLNKNVKILKMLIEDVDFHSLEVVRGVSAETKTELATLIKYLEKKASAGVKRSQAGKRKWTKEENEKLLALVNEGRSVSEISLALDRSKLAINTRIAKLIVTNGKVNN